MNVFDLPGPQFLVLYILFTITLVVLAAAAILRPSRQDAPGTSLLADPYQIAYLRGGVPEVLRLAVVTLAERGLIDLTPTGQVVSAGVAVPRGLPSIERAILANATHVPVRVCHLQPTSRRS